MKRRWIVSYIANSGWPVYRYFKTRPKAWAFYKKLWQRPRPPWEQSINQEVFPIELRDLRMVDYRSGLFAKIEIKGRRIVILPFDKPLQYDDLLKALNHSGFILPAKHPGRRAWCAFLNGTDRP